MTSLCYNVFDREKETNTKQNRWDYVCRHWLALFFYFYFQKNHGFIEKEKPSENVVIVGEELNRFDIDGTENLENLTRFLFIDEECVNLEVVNDDKELTRNINQKRKVGIPQIACWCSLCDKCKPKYFFNNHV